MRVHQTYKLRHFKTRAVSKTKSKHRNQKLRESKETPCCPWVGWKATEHEDWSYNPKDQLEELRSPAQPGHWARTTEPKLQYQQPPGASQHRFVKQRHRSSDLSLKFWSAAVKVEGVSCTPGGTGLSAPPRAPAGSSAHPGASWTGWMPGEVCNGLSTGTPREGSWCSSCLLSGGVTLLQRPIPHLSHAQPSNNPQPLTHQMLLRKCSAYII